MISRTPSIVKGNKSLHLVWAKWGSQWWGLGKAFNVLQSPIGQMASRLMRTIETFPSQQMYLYLSLVEKKVTEFYHYIDRRRYLVWLKWLIFITFFQTIAGVLNTINATVSSGFQILLIIIRYCQMLNITKYYSHLSVHPLPQHQVDPKYLRASSGSTGPGKLVS